MPVTAKMTIGMIACACLAACGTVHLPRPDLAALAEPGVDRVSGVGPPGAPPGTCWGKQITPAVIETVTEQVMLQPAQVGTDGIVRAPAVYKTETRQRIVKERRESWFETPCPSVLTPGFIASLQRALQARGHYRGLVNGEMTAATRAAVRRFQAPQGLNSAILSLAAARQLGLIQVPRPAPKD